MLLAIGPKVTRIGGSGLACQMKIAVNLLLMVEVIAFGEAVALAEKGGVAREVAVDAILKSVAASPVLGYRGPFILEGKMPEVPLADVTLQQKDMLLALDLGRKLGSPVPLAAAANEMMNACRGLGIDHQRFRRRAPGLPPPGRTIMTSKAKRSAPRLAKAVKSTAAQHRRTSDPAPKMYRTNMQRRAEGRRPQARRRLGRHAGAVPDRQEIRRRRPRRRLDRAQARRAPREPSPSQLRRVLHRAQGQGPHLHRQGEEPSGEGDVVYSPRGCWHGFNNTSNEDVVLVWGWMGAGSIEASGYEVDPEGHK